jgi:hypothetical protein
VADSKISELLELTDAQNDDLFVAVDVSAVPQTTKKIKLSNMSRVFFAASTLGTAQATTAVNGAFVTLSFNSDFALAMDAVMDRPAASRFRALIDGWYEVTYQMYGSPAANNRSAEFRLLKNGTTALTGSKMQLSQGQASATVGGFCSKIFPVYLAANDYIELQAAATDATIVTMQDFSTLNFKYLKS